MPFLRSGSGTLSFAAYWHGKTFRPAWYGILTAMGYRTETIQGLDESKPFYRNIYIIKSRILASLVQDMSRAMDIAETDSKVADLLNVDSKYKEGNVEVALKVFGTTYYKLHPFIFERLPSFFLHVNASKICHGTEGPCKYNT